MSGTLRREVLWLVAAVLIVDAMFLGFYYLGGMRTARDPVKLGYTVLWTLITLGVVLRGLTRVRRARGGSRPLGRR